MKSVVLTIAERDVPRVHSIAEMLKNEGLKVTNVYDFGVIAGLAEDDVIHKLKKYKEVVSLTEEKHIDIGPPDKEIQ